jgi:hypothetical protein
MRATPTTTAPENALHALVGLAPLMAASQGSPSVTVAVIDGSIDRGHPALAEAQIVTPASVFLPTSHSVIEVLRPRP